jgi:hypothetical protein
VKADLVANYRGGHKLIYYRLDYFNCKGWRIPMGKWEDLEKEMASMSSSERNKLLDELKDSCYCIDCPTNVPYHGEEKPTLFCFLGKYDCELTMLGCLCPNCPVKERAGLLKFYYCIRGDEKAQRGP